MGDFWDDHAAMRPGTPGGDTAIQSFKNSISKGNFPAPPPPKFPTAAKAQKIPKVAKPMKAVDFMVAAVVWLVAWQILWHSAGMDGGGAAAAAIIPCAIAAKWWRPLIVMGFVGIALWYFVLHAK